MYLHRHVKRRIRQVALTLTVCISLGLIPNIPGLVRGETQGPNQDSDRGARPRRAKPEGTLPNLDAIQTESQGEREAPASVLIRLRPPRNIGKPWDGRRVGDPEPPVNLDQIRRAHARKR